MSVEAIREVLEGAAHRSDLAQEPPISTLGVMEVMTKVTTQCGNQKCGPRLNPKCVRFKGNVPAFLETAFTVNAAYVDSIGHYLLIALITQIFCDTD